MRAEYDTYLAHHGVKGMRWGQNLMAGKMVNNKKPESSKWKAKDAGNLSDEELRRRLTRLQQEKQYKEMTASRATKTRKWIGKTAGKILVTTAVGVLATAAATKYKAVAEDAGMLPVSAVERKYNSSFSAPHTSAG